MEDSILRLRDPRSVSVWRTSGHGSGTPMRFLQQWPPRRQRTSKRRKTMFWGCGGAN